MEKKFLMLNGLEIPIPLSSPNSDSKEMHGIGEENLHFDDGNEVVKSRTKGIFWSVLVFVAK